MTPFDQIGNWLHGVWFGYFWPSLIGNGPEDIISFVLLGFFAGWVGKWAKAEWDKHKAHQEHVTAKLDHIILNHPKIPNQVPGLAEHHQPKGQDATPRKK